MMGSNDPSGRKLAGELSFAALVTGTGSARILAVFFSSFWGRVKPNWRPVMSHNMTLTAPEEANRDPERIAQPWFK